MWSWLLQWVSIPDFNLGWNVSAVQGIDVFYRIRYKSGHRERSYTTFGKDFTVGYLQVINYERVG